MAVVDFGLGPAYKVVIVGNSQAKDTKEMLRALSGQFMPNKVVIFRPTEQKRPAIDQLAEYVKLLR